MTSQGFCATSNKFTVTQVDRFATKKTIFPVKVLYQNG